MEPSESNAFARAVAGDAPPSRLGVRARFALGVALTLVLAGLVTVAFFFVGALILRGVAHHDWRAGGAAVAVMGITFVMARGRRRR